MMSMKNSTKKHPQTCALRLNMLSKTLFVATIFTLLTLGTGNAFAAPVPGITGYYFYMCKGATAPFFDDAPGGVWSISPATASVASVSSVGVVTGLSAGTATLSYTVGGSSASIVVTVFATPDPIAGPGSICLSSEMNLSDTGAGGVWSSGIPSTATVGSTGIVTANNPGVVPIYFTYTVSGCRATKVLTVNATPAPIGGPAAVCTGTSIILTEATGGGTWYSITPAIGSISTSGVLTGRAGGTTTISYAATNNCKTTRVITVDVTAVAGTITGQNTICVAATAALSDTASGGVWSSTNGSVATVDSIGNITGMSAGTTLITYAVTNSCGTVVTTHALTVNPQPYAGTISGSATICVGATQSLSDASAGGAWGATGGASVDGSGNITGLTAGTASISYTVVNSCGTAYTSFMVTVNALPDPGTISGAARLCAATTALFTATVPGGVWSATGNAATDGLGNVTGITAGTAMISYSLSNSCGTVSATEVTTIDPLANAGVITGNPVVCVGTSVHLTDAAVGGSWSATPDVSIDAFGNITGIAAGTATISYIVTNGCGAAVASMAVTVNAVSVGAITGLSVVNVGSAINLSDSVAGGVWTSSNSNVTIGSNGVVTGIMPGTSTISYSITSVCSNALATKTITVNSVNGTPGSITGYYFYLCTGNTAPFFNAVAGGTWSISPLSVATVSATGVVTGLTAGTATLSYTLSGLPATAIVTVYPTPAAIMGSAAVCQGATTVLSDITPGGVWSSGIPSTATVGTGGIVSATNAGMVPVYYTMVATGCRASVMITVNPNPAAITGPVKVCTAATIALNSATAGGSWSSANAYASVDNAGIVNGISAGSAIVSYTLGTGCFRAAPITVNQAPAPISGTLSVCAGSRTFLSDAVAGISWSSSNTGIATVSASGRVTGIFAGTSVITYLLANTCITTSVVTVNALPAVAAIMGASVVTYSVPATLSDTTSGGLWTSSNAAIISVGSGTGVVSAAATSGSVYITYMVTNSFGCSATVGKAVSVATPHGRTGNGSTAPDVNTTQSDDITAGELVSDETISAAESTTGERVSVPSIPMSIGLFPNPNRGMFFVKGTAGAAIDALVNYEIINSVGQVVYTATTIAAGGVINEQLVLPENLSNGLYMLNVGNGAKRKVISFVVEK